MLHRLSVYDVKCVFKRKRKIITEISFWLLNANDVQFKWMHHLQIFTYLSGSLKDYLLVPKSLCLLRNPHMYIYQYIMYLHIGHWTHICLIVIVVVARTQKKTVQTTFQFCWHIFHLGTMERTGQHYTVIKFTKIENKKTATRKCCAVIGTDIYYEEISINS